MAKPKTAIIGTGISGLGAAYILNPYHDITVFEKNDYIGGHSRTIDVDVDTIKRPVDTGFIVFNKRNYPHLVALFDSLGVAYEKSDMSFGVNINQGWLAYSSSNLFAQKKNLLRPQFWGMVSDILRFNKCAETYLDRGSEYSLAQCLD
jgi:predicted NAD/FAD-binding protein